MIQDINRKIKEAGLITANKFLYAFLENEDALVSQLKHYNGLQSEIYLNNREGELEQLKFASIFSDLISMYTVSPVTATHHFTTFESESQYGYEREITIPNTLSNEILPKYHLLPGYSYHTSSDLKKTIKYCEPLLDDAKAILRPIRTLWVDKKHITGKKESMLYYAQGNTDTRHWVIKDTFDKGKMTIENYLKPTKVEQLIELTIPYFRDIKLDRLSKILKDEEACISPFRKELKTLITNFDELETNIHEFREDVLRPQIDTINRKFQHVKSVHSLRIVGAISLFSLSLIKVFLPGDNITELINNIISGTSFSAIIISENKYQTDINSLKDNPYFLLWRIKKLT
jgi:hypothetical protein